MDYWLSDEQAAIQQAVREFVANECPREEARALDAQAAFPAEWAKRLGALGFCGLNVPEEFGGGGQDLVSTALVIAELAQIAPVLAIAFSASALRGGWTIARWGSPAQQRKMLPLLAAGHARLTLAAEPGDEQALCAVGGEGEYRLNGCARLVAMADQSDLVLTLAHPPVGWTVFVIPSSSSGLQVARIDKVGTRGAALCRVAYEQVSVTVEQILGGPEQLGQGARVWQELEAIQGIETAALCLGIAQGALDYASDYARERVQFGKAIASFEPIQHMLVDMTVNIRALRLMLWEACSLANRARAWHVQAAMARLTGVTVARQAAFQCLHILGGYGYTLEYDAQRYVRDALALVDGSASIEEYKNELGVLLGFGPVDRR